MIDFLMILGGLVFLFFGGESLLRGSVSIARHFGLSKFLVSAIIVGFGTSLPELTVSVGAALQGSPAIALGNIVGSNIANILLILSLGIIIFPVIVKDFAVKRDAAIMVGASLMLCAFAVLGVFSFISGFILFAALLGYVGWSYVADKKNHAQTANSEDVNQDKPIKPIMAAIYTVIGLALLVVGAKLMVDGAIAFARDFGISEAVIGLTIVAVGTSLPELATSIVAALRKQSDVIIGNVLGSNIFNILGILGITAMIEPIPIAPQMLNFDIWLMLGVATFLSILLWFSRKGIGRITGFSMLGIYIAYTAWLYVGT